MTQVQHVLIESDWNLNQRKTSARCPMHPGINRIRLEFKFYSPPFFPNFSRNVLIESDWNLNDTEAAVIAYQKAY